MLISSDHTLLDLDFIFNYLSKESNWVKDLTMDVLKESIHNSICYGVYIENNTQIAFIRVITDRTTFAYLSDLFVDTKYRGQGFATKLIGHILHDEIIKANYWLIQPSNSHPLYTQFGFKPVDYTTMDLYKDKI